jgi:hypothetical protein
MGGIDLSWLAGALVAGVVYAAALMLGGGLVRARLATATR